MSTYQRASHVFSSMMPDGEYAILDVERSTYYGLNPVAARLWELLDEPTTLEALVEKLVLEFEVAESQCRTEVERFIADMHAKALIERVG